MITDILGAVNDFILAYIFNEEVPPLSQEQIVIGWQNIVSALPKGTQEYAILTLLHSKRHGTNIRMRELPTTSGIKETVSRLAEHMVQIDYCSAYPQQTEDIARTRAELTEMLHRDAIAVNFYRQYGISSCYAEDIVALPFQNESEQWVARYVCTIHLSGYIAKNFEYGEDSYFESVDLKIRPSQNNDGSQGQNTIDLYVENVGVHHNS